MTEEEGEVSRSPGALAYFRLQTRFNQRGRTQSKHNIDNKVTVTSNKETKLASLGDLWKKEFLTTEEDQAFPVSPIDQLEFRIENQPNIVDNEEKISTESLERVPALVTTSVEFVSYDLVKEMVDRQARFKKLFNKVIAGTLNVQPGVRKIGHLRKTEIRFLNDAKEKLEKRLVDLKSTAFKKMCAQT